MFGIAVKDFHTCHERSVGHLDYADAAYNETFWHLVDNIYYCCLLYFYHKPRAPMCSILQKQEILSAPLFVSYIWTEF